MAEHHAASKEAAGQAVSHAAQLYPSPVRLHCTGCPAQARGHIQWLGGPLPPTCSCLLDPCLLLLSFQASHSHPAGSRWPQEQRKASGGAAGVTLSLASRSLALRTLLSAAPGLGAQHGLQPGSQVLARRSVGIPLSAAPLGGDDGEGRTVALHRAVSSLQAELRRRLGLGGHLLPRPQHADAASQRSERSLRQRQLQLVGHLGKGGGKQWWVVMSVGRRQSHSRWELPRLWAPAAERAPGACAAQHFTSARAKREASTARVEAQSVRRPSSCAACSTASTAGWPASGEFTAVVSQLCTAEE